jgi:hypothetical protein
MRDIRRALLEADVGAALRIHFCPCIQALRVMLLLLPAGKFAGRETVRVVCE